ncbi:NAD(P)-dependent alcohol dehydrogenase, variant 3 [Balamuthia mandrillaris]
MAALRTSALRSRPFSSSCTAVGIPLRTFSTTRAHTSGERMKGVLMTNYGSPEVLQYSENLPLPELGPRDVLVRVHYSSLNPIDVAIRSGYGRELLSKLRTPSLPCVLGYDCVGTVTKVGTEVWNWAEGDKVWGATDVLRNGCHAEYVAVNEHLLAPLPKTIPEEEAAGIPYVGLTSWRALVDVAKLVPNENKKILVHGGGGGVGYFSLQLLKAWGFSVATTCSTANVAKLQAILNQNDQIVDYKKEDFTKRLHPEFDIILDTVGGIEMETKNLALLKSTGHYLSLKGPLLTETDNSGLFQGLISGANQIAQKKVSSGTKRFDYVLYKPNGDALQKITSLVEAKQITGNVDSMYNLNQLQFAHSYFEHHKAHGKVIIKI